MTKSWGRTGMPPTSGNTAALSPTSPTSPNSQIPPPPLQCPPCDSPFSSLHLSLFPSCTHARTTAGTLPTTRHRSARHTCSALASEITGHSHHPTTDLTVPGGVLTASALPRSPAHPLKPLTSASLHCRHLRPRHSRQRNHHRQRRLRPLRPQNRNNHQLS